MANYYYLLSSLPLLSLNQSELPMERESLLSSFETGLNDPKLYRLILSTSLVPVTLEDEMKKNEVINLYGSWERGLRNTLVSGLAEKVSFRAEDSLQAGDVTLAGEEVGREALAKENPLERQQFIAHERWRFLDLQWGVTPFNFKSVQIYYLRWQVLEELTAYREEEGQVAFEAHYNKISASLGSFDFSQF